MCSNGNWGGGKSSDSTKGNAGTAETKEDDSTDTAKSDFKLAWYAPTPHPYFEEMQKGVEQFKTEQGVDVIIQIGPDWNQAGENEKVETLIAQGVNAISIYLCGASDANGLFEEIHEKMGLT